VLVLLSIALVIGASVLLLLGLFADDGLTLIYLSIACSAVSAVVLLVALRRNRPRAERVAMPEPLPVAASPVATPVPAAASTVPAAIPEPSRPSEGEWLASDWAEGDDAETGVDDVDEEVDFPIADYDELTAGQILPLLPQLYADEIGVVEQRERDTKGRPEILDRLAQLRGDEPPSAPSPAWAVEEEWFPIEDYESLSAAQIRPLLGELDAEELALVRGREMALGRRRSLLDEIDRRLNTAPTVAEPAPAPAPAPEVVAPPVKAATAKATAKKTAASKAPASRPPAKKATGSKAPGTKAKAPAKKAPAKSTAKAPARKATTTKSTAKKTATKTAKASTTKASAAKSPAKAPAKKAVKK
jgi:hypothetical protein